MKRESQIIVRCKQLIKIEKLFQGLLPFYVLQGGERNILQTVLLSFFSGFIFSLPSEVIIIVIQFMFLGINIFRALLRAHFNPCPTAWTKMSQSRAQNIFMPANINSIVLLLSLCRALWRILRAKMENLAG